MKAPLLINVLSKNSYDNCHIRGSINVPYNEIEAWAQKQSDKDAYIVLYCMSYSCPASTIACLLLMAHGFTNVHIYEGGMNEWLHAGLPTDGACDVENLKKKITRADKFKISEVDLSQLRNDCGC